MTTAAYFVLLTAMAHGFVVRRHTRDILEPKYISSILDTNPDTPSVSIEGKCGLTFNINDTNTARHIFETELKDETVYCFFIYLKQKKSDPKILSEYLPDNQDRNGLQEWTWMVVRARYEIISLPMDFVALTFTISEYGTRPLHIPFTLSENCNNNTSVVYENETVSVVNYLWSAIIGNISDSYICHRSEKDTSAQATLIWWITTVWIGYDWNCYYIADLITGKVQYKTFSKYDITKILSVFLGIIAYMYPFACSFVEGFQPKKEDKLYLYNKKDVKSIKPYSPSRFLQKVFFTPWKTIDKRDEFSYKYAPILRYYLMMCLLLMGFSLYKYFSIGNEYWNAKDEYTQFPQAYRFGVPEYYKWHLKGSFFKSLDCAVLFPLVFSLLTFVVLNVWIYSTYNDTDDFVFILSPRESLCTEIKDIMSPNDECQHNQHDQSFSSTVHSNSNPWLLQTSRKLIFRFTILFSIRFWAFVLKSSFCPKWNCDFINKKFIPYLSFAYLPVGFITFIINVAISLLFCSLPALWFWFYMPVALFKKYKDTKKRISGNCHEDNTQSQLETANNAEPGYAMRRMIIEIIIFVPAYGFTLRENISLVVYMLRTFFNLIIAGFTVSDYVWRVYLISIFAFGYFVTYFYSFIETYEVLINLIFDIQDEVNNIQDENCQPESTNEDNDVQDESGKPEPTNEVGEDLFNYVVDHFHYVQKRVFLFFLKTTVTITFLTVTLIIWRNTGRFDNTANLNDILSILFILLSPKLVTSIANNIHNNTEEDMNKHKAEIKDLINNYNNYNQSRKRNIGSSDGDENERDSYLWLKGCFGSCFNACSKPSQTEIKCLNLICLAFCCCCYEKKEDMNEYELLRDSGTPTTLDQ